MATNLDFVGCVFVEVDEPNGTLTTSFGWGRKGEPNLIRTFRTSDYLSDAFAVENRARRPVLVSDTQTDPRVDAEAYAALNIRAFLTIPHHRDDGVSTHYLGITSPRPRVWMADEVQLLQTFSSLVFSRLVRAQSEVALRESEAQFRTIADAVPQIVWITGPDGRLEFFNRQWSQCTGIVFAPATAADIAAEVIHPDDVEKTLACFNEAFCEGSPFEVEHRIRSARGNTAGSWFARSRSSILRPGTSRGGSAHRWTFTTATFCTHHSSWPLALLTALPTVVKCTPKWAAIYV